MILETLEALLECVQEALGDENPVCRAFINPGPDAPHDVCSTGVVDGVDVNGQLWVAHLGSTSGWPVPTGQPTTCATTFTNRCEVGIVRCVMGMMQDDGSAPEASKITDDAVAQLRDKQTLLMAIICCMPVEGKDLVVEEWAPIPPAGGCVGGIWTFSVRDAGCSCGSLES